MDILVSILQVLATLLFGASGSMKVFMFEKVSEGVPSFGALPRKAWTALGILELICVLGLVIPEIFQCWPLLAAASAAVLALECLVFVWVHVKYKETGAVAMSAVLGILMAFIAYGRWAAS